MSFLILILSISIVSPILHVRKYASMHIRINIA
jgi:hypothetical protein